MAGLPSTWVKAYVENPWSTDKLLGWVGCQQVCGPLDPLLWKWVASLVLNHYGAGSYRIAERSLSQGWNPALLRRN